MINIRFFQNIQKIDVKGEAPICMTLTFNGNRIRKSVKDLKVKVNDWNSAKGRVKSKVTNNRGLTADLMNARLEELEENIRKINKVVLRENIRLSEDYIISKIENPQSIDTQLISFFDAFDDYINSSKSFKAYRTILNQTTVKNYLEGFQKKKKIKIQFDTIDMVFFDALRDYSFREKEITDNYFAKIISVLKSFLNWANDRKYITKDDYRRFKAPEREKEVIYLTEEELFTLYYHSFKSLKLEHVKDTFCFACFTGLRFSDIKALEVSDIKGENIVKSIQKTKEVDFKIPLNIFALEVLKKYQHTIHAPLPRISAQKFNEYLKICCEEAGIIELTTVIDYRGSQTHRITLPKYKLVTSQVARKTFTTNSLIFGMKDRVVMSFTGHTSESSFRRYVKIADSFKKSEVDRTWNTIRVK